MAMDVVVSSVSGHKFLQEVEAGDHRLHADEPRDFGGGDAGLGPYELLLAALGTCTSMTLRMYADRKGWALDKVVVRLIHKRIHERDCEECESGSGFLDEITKEIRLEGALEGDQRSRLLDIADRCPVHKTLKSDIVIRTVLK